MHEIQRINRTPISRQTMILLATITPAKAAGTNALAIAYGGGGGRHGGRSGFGLLSVEFGDSQASIVIRAR